MLFKRTVSLCGRFPVRLLTCFISAQFLSDEHSICRPTCCALEICDATEVELLNQHILHSAEAPLWCEAKKQRGSSSGHISKLKACCQLSLMSLLSGWIWWDLRTLLISRGAGANEAVKVLRLCLACASKMLRISSIRDLLHHHQLLKNKDNPYSYVSGPKIDVVLGWHYGSGKTNYVILYPKTQS